MCFELQRVPDTFLIVGRWLFPVDRCRESIEAAGRLHQGSPQEGGEPMSRKRHRPPPPADDHELKRTVIAAFAQGVGRGAVVVIWEWLRGGHWL